MSIKITSASIDDLSKIKELNLKLFDKEFNEFDDTVDCNWPMSEEADKYFKNKINNTDGCLFVARNNDDVIGYLAGGFSDIASYRNIKGSMAELENMLIEDQFRGKGVGSALIEAFTGWCHKNKVNRLRVIASFKNNDGINFYQKNGFDPLEVVLEKEI